MVSESNHQQAVIKWSKQPTVRERYPELALLHHIKMKNETGRANDAQNWWLERLKLEGNYTVVCHGWQSAVDVLTWYLGLGEYHA